MKTPELTCTIVNCTVKLSYSELFDQCTEVRFASFLSGGYSESAGRIVGKSNLYAMKNGSLSGCSLNNTY